MWWCYSHITASDIEARACIATGRLYRSAKWRRNKRESIMRKKKRYRKRKEQCVGWCEEENEE